jgi:hypothetical protein
MASSFGPVEVKNSTTDDFTLDIIGKLNAA